MYLRVGGPPVPEQTNRDRKAREDEGRQAGFWSHGDALGLETFYACIRGQAEDEEAGEGADADADESEADDACAEAVGGLEDLGHGGEEEVLVAVGYGHVDLDVRLRELGDKLRSQIVLTARSRTMGENKSILVGRVTALAKRTWVGWVSAVEQMYVECLVNRFRPLAFRLSKMGS